MTIFISKIRRKDIKLVVLKSKLIYEFVYYSVATLSKSYITVTGIIMKSIG